MAEHHIPKGVDLDTLQEIIAGWGEVGAVEEPTYTTAVEDVTSISDAVGRQTRFLEEIGVLEPHKQKHRLTDAGGKLASALTAGRDERARTQARELLSNWELTEDVRGVVEGYPMGEADLIPITAQLAGVDLGTSRVETGIRTLLDLYEWAGLLDRDAQGRYRFPEAASAADGTKPGEDAPEGTTDEAAYHGAVSEKPGLPMDTAGPPKDAAEAVATVPSAAGWDAPERAGTAAGGDVAGAAENAPRAFRPAADAGEIALTVGDDPGIEIAVDERSDVAIGADGDIELRDEGRPGEVRIGCYEGEDGAEPSRLDDRQPAGDSAVEAGNDSVDPTEANGRLRIDVDSGPGIVVAVGGEGGAGTDEATTRDVRDEPENAEGDANDASEERREDEWDAAGRAERGTDGAADDGEVDAGGEAGALADGDASQEVVAELANTVMEAKGAAEEARAAADAARAAAEAASDGGADDTPATEPHAVSLAIDIDSADLEAIISGVKDGLRTDDS